MNGIPEDIVAAGQLIRTLESKAVITRHDREAITKAKLRIAFWACGTENLPVSRDNLSFVLGPAARDIMSAYDRAMEREREAAVKTGAGKAAAKKGRSKPDFWGGI